MTCALLRSTCLKIGEDDDGDVSKQISFLAISTTAEASNTTLVVAFAVARLITVFGPLLRYFVKML